MSESSRTGATDPEVEVPCTCPVEWWDVARQWNAPGGVHLTECTVHTARAAAAPPSSQRQTREDRLRIQHNNRCAGEIADRYFSKDEEEWGQLYTDVLAALTGDLLPVPAALLAEQPGGGR